MQAMDVVRQLEGLSRYSRKDIIADMLTALGADFAAVPLPGQYFRPVNITGCIDGAGKKVIGISSHYDSCDRSPGANDNCSGVAVILSLVERLMANPPKHFGIEYCFFDLEEIGMAGSENYVAANLSRLRQSLIGNINLDMVGCGEHILMQPVKKYNKSYLVQAVEQQATTMGSDSIRMTYLHGRSSDHRSFVLNDLEAFTIMAISEEDLTAFKMYDQQFSSDPFITASELNDILNKAPVYRHHHGRRDTADKLSESTLGMVTDIVYNSIHCLDRNFKAPSQHSSSH